jgi:hypothetical protein
LGDPRATTRARDTASEEAPAGLRWALDVSAHTSLPLLVGAEVQLQSPIGITAHVAFGHTPAAYLEAVAAVLLDAGAYDPKFDPVVQDGIHNGAWNVRAGLGFTIVEGLELAAGYTYLFADTAISSEAIESAIGQALPNTAVNAALLDVSLHALSLRLGWRFVIEQHFVLRFALGWTHALESEVHLEVPPELDPAGGPVDRVEVSIQEGVGRYGFTPEILISAGYRFF